jgi:hypothetical protein
LTTPVAQNFAGVGAVSPEMEPAGGRYLTNAASRKRSIPSSQANFASRQAIDRIAEANFASGEAIDHIVASEFRIGRSNRSHRRKRISHRAK